MPLPAGSLLCCNVNAAVFVTAPHQRVGGFCNDFGNGSFQGVRGTGASLMVEREGVGIDSHGYALNWLLTPLLSKTAKTCAGIERFGEASQVCPLRKVVWGRRKQRHSCSGQGVAYELVGWPLTVQPGAK